MTTPQSYAVSRLVDADSWRQLQQAGNPSGVYPSGSEPHAGPLGNLRDSYSEVAAAAGVKAPSSGDDEDQDESTSDYSSSERAAMRASDADAPKQGVYAMGGRMAHIRTGVDAHVTDLGRA